MEEHRLFYIVVTSGKIPILKTGNLSKPEQNQGNNQIPIPKPFFLEEIFFPQ